MLIRDFGESDVAFANVLTNHFILNTAVHFGTEPASEAQYREYWIAGRQTYPWLVGEVDGRPAGVARAYRWRERDAYKLTAETGIYMAAEHQGRGLGKQLYAALLERLRAMGFRTAIGGITLPNPASVRLHETLGFRAVGVFRAVGRKFEQWHDVGFWQIDLHTAGN